MKKTGAAALLLAAFGLTGCACVSQDYVDRQDILLMDEIGKVNSKVVSDEAKMMEFGRRMDAMASELAAARADAANARAMAADAARKADDCKATCEAKAPTTQETFEMQQKK